MNLTPRTISCALLASSTLACSGAVTPAAPTTPSPAPPGRLRVVATQWEEPRTIGDAGARPADRCLEQPSCARPYRQAAPVVAANGAGAVVALWQRHVAGQYRMVAARGGLRQDWSAPVEILAPARSLFPRLAIDRQGRALAVWSAEGSVYASQGPSGGGWSPPQGLVAGTVPSLAMDDAGQAYLVVTRGEGVFALRANPRGEWTPPELVDGDTPFQPATASITADGSAVAVWTRGAAPNVWGYGREWTETRTSATRPGERWSPAAAVGSIEGGWGFDLQSSGGNALVFATSSAQGVDAYRNEIWAQHRVDGGWSAPFQLSGPRSSGTPWRTSPRLATWSGGDTLAAWMESTEGTFRPGDERHWIRARTFSKESGTWGPVVTVADRAELGSDTVGLRLATSAAGNALVVWGSGAGGLSASDFVPATGWSAPRPLRASAGSAPEIAMDDAGNAIVVWTEFGDPMTVQAARLLSVTVPAP